MAKWLFKTEPNDYNWEQFVQDGRTEWDGVKNYQAANNMRAMKLGDLAFFYRSVKDPAVVGTMEVIRTAYPDPDDPSGKFVRVDLKPVEPLANEVSLKAIKSAPNLMDLALVRQSRLSVMPVTDSHWKTILELSSAQKN